MKRDDDTVRISYTSMTRIVFRDLRDILLDGRTSDIFDSSLQLKYDPKTDNKEYQLDNPNVSPYLQSYFNWMYKQNLNRNSRLSESLAS